MGKKKQNYDAWQKSLGGSAAPSDDHAYDEGNSRNRELHAEEAVAWAAGRNLVVEGDKLVDLDRLSVSALHSKMYQKEYSEDARGGEPRKRLVALIERKTNTANEGRSDDEVAEHLKSLSAKEYVAWFRRYADTPDEMYTHGFQSEQVFGALERLNHEIAVVKVGNAVKYMVPGIDGAGRTEYRFLSSKDFHQLYANVIVPRMALAMAGLAPGRGGDLKLSKLWDEWNDRRELEGFGFYPGSDKHPSQVPKGYLNLWTGLAVEPKKGDWSLFRKHLRDKVCGGKREHFSFLMDWLAHAVQRPQEKPGSAVVICSSQKGSGKSMLLRFLRKIFGRHLYTAARAEQLTGKFNGHLEETLIFGVEEGLWAGSHANNSVLKDLITAEQISIERKGLDSKNVPNYTRFIFLSNEDWVVPVGTDERRYFVLDFEHERAKDQSYFDPIYEQMEEEGGIEAMLHDLMEREIKANLRNPPKTEGLLKQRVHGLDGCDRFLVELATEGEADAKNLEVGICLNKHKPVAVPKALVWRVAESFAAGRHEERALQTRLGAKLKALSVEVVEKRTASDRRSFVFPPLPDFQRRVADLLGVVIDVKDDGMREDEIAGGLYDAKTKQTAKVIGLNQHIVKTQRKAVQPGRMH